MLFQVAMVVLLVSCQKETTPLFASCKAFPTYGDTTVMFEFDASQSLNHQNFSSGLSFRWDFENDGIWDTDWRLTKGAAHLFINPGTYKVVVEVIDNAGATDTASVVVETFGRNNDISTMQDPRNERIYSIAKFRGYWWMRDNLNYGEILNPFQLQTNNAIVEQYSGLSRETHDTVYGLYNWKEAMNYNYSDNQGICPPGWHIPSTKEWGVLLDGLPESYAVRFYGKDGLSGLNLQMGEFLRGDRHEQIYTIDIGYKGFWASDFTRSSTGQFLLWGVFFLDQGQINTIGTTFWEINDYLIHEMDYIRSRPVRCIKKE